MSKMNWTPETDAKLMLSIIKQCDVKITGEDYKALAEVMGCTPKAISRRLDKIKDKASSGGKTEEGEDGGAPTAAGRKKKGPAKKGRSGDVSGEECTGVKREREEDGGDEDRVVKKKTRGGEIGGEDEFT